MNINRIITSILLLIISLQAWSQLNFKNFTIDDGLAQSVVNCVFQDSEGFMWFGTQDGLNQFDGYNFNTFKHNPVDTNSLRNNWIYDICEDNQGRIWIGTRAGLHIYNKQTGHFQCIAMEDGLYRKNVYGLLYSKNGSIIANTPPAINIINIEDFSVKSYVNSLETGNTTEDQKHPVIEDHKGNFWMATPNGLSVFNPENNSFQFTQKYQEIYKYSEKITALHLDRFQNIWIGTKEGLFIIDNQSKISTYRTENSKIPANFIRHISADSKGNIWLGTENGGLLKVAVNPVNGTPFDFTQYSTQTSQTGIILNDIVLDVHEDKSNVLWIGTLSGINYVDLKPVKFRLYRKTNDNNSVNFTSNVLASVYKEHDDLIWVGTWGAGLNKFNRNTGEVVHYTTDKKGKFHIPNNFAHVLFKDSKNRFWLGTRGGVCIYNKQTEAFDDFLTVIENKELPSFKQNRIYCMLEDSKNNIWFGTRDGLYKFSEDFNSYSYFNTESTPSLTENLIYDIMEDSDRNIWVATTAGINILNPETKHVKQITSEIGNIDGLRDNFTVSLCLDPNNNVWIGTKSGLQCYVKETGKFEFYDHEAGIPASTIYEILLDNNKNLWLGTGDGLTRFNIETKKTRTFDVEDGTQSIEFNLNVRHKADDGEIFYGGMNGLNSFYANSLYNNPYVPPTVITKFTIETENGKKVINTYKRKLIRLPYNENTFTIDFTSLDYTNPVKNQYQYKIEESNEKWITLEKRRFVAFSGLAPGTYTFKVRGSNNDGIWNDEGKTLKIVIRPPWWKSRIAYAIYLILAVVLIVILIKRRERRLIQEKRVLEDKVAERTQEIELQKTKIEKAYENVKELSVIGQQITSHLSIESIIETVYENVNTLMDASIFTVGIYNEPENAIDFPRTLEEGKQIPFYSFSLEKDELPAVKCFKQNKEILIQSSEEIKDVVNNMPRTGKAPESLLYIPLLQGDKVMGVITVQSFNKEAYKSFQINILKNIAIYTTIALENADAFIQIENQKEEIEAQRDEIQAQRDLATEQRDQIIKQKQSITDSIQYAQRIQNAVLPHKDDFSDNFDDHFVLYMPKDIVSGDFYWFKKQNGYTYLAAADCTGHGVPGAFVSLLGISYLNDIVIQNKHTEASQILNSLRKRVKSSLQQNKADVGSRDGMDMAFCMINNETNEVNFAGAYNPLYIFRNNELINLKADKMPIGVHKKERDFLNQKFQLLKGDCLYMFSDGFIDQFGGPDGKKYLRKRFNEFLQDIHNLPMTEQRSLLLKEHINWKGNYSQIDDILVIGLKI